jgi:hypothetical protein
MAKAVLIYQDKAALADGSIVEMTIWRLPATTGERPHGLKFSLFYGRPGERIIGYDNEAGKGDHRHYRGQEAPYLFRGVDQMIADFLADVEKERNP